MRLTERIFVEFAGEQSDQIVGMLESGGLNRDHGAWSFLRAFEGSVMRDLHRSSSAIVSIDTARALTTKPWATLGSFNRLCETVLAPVGYSEHEGMTFYISADYRFFASGDDDLFHVGDDLVSAISAMFNADGYAWTPLNPGNRF